MALSKINMALPSARAVRLDDIVTWTGASKHSAGLYAYVSPDGSLQIIGRIKEGGTTQPDLSRFELPESIYQARSYDVPLGIVVASGVLLAHAYIRADTRRVCISSTDRAPCKGGLYSIPQGTEIYINAIVPKQP